MAGQSRIRGSGELAERWDRWANVVSLFAFRKAKRHAVDPEEYQQLHASLLRLCRQRTVSEDPADRKTLEQLEDILRPWVTLDSLHWAERDIVYRLFEQCEKAQRVLGGRRRSKVSRKSLVRVLLGALALVAVGYLLLDLWRDDWATWSPLTAIREWLWRLDSALVHLDGGYGLVVGGGIVTVLLLVVVWFSTKRT